jgi:hypothetical protein
MPTMLLMGVGSIVKDPVVDHAKKAFILILRLRHVSSIIPLLTV